MGDLEAIGNLQTGINGAQWFQKKGWVGRISENSVYVYMYKLFFQEARGEAEKQSIVRG